MAAGTTNQHRSIQQRCERGSTLKIAEKSLKGSERLESDGVSVGTKSGKNYQALVELRDAAQAQLIIAEAILKANYSREAHVTRAAVKRAFLNACDTVSRF